MSGQCGSVRKGGQSMLVLDVFQDGLEVASSEDAAEYGVQEVAA